MTSLDHIYLDNNASTPIDERVLDAMLPYLRAQYGNPSSVYQLGRAARAAMDVAREQVAALVNAHPSQVVFTSGGTEANNLALKGAAGRLTPGRLIVSAVEHGSVRAPAQALRKQGWKLNNIGVDEQGRLELRQLNELISIQQPGTANPINLASTAKRKPVHGKIVAVMLANNETGVINNIGAVAELARKNDAVLFVDAVQAAGKIPVDFTALGAQMMSLSAHKMYGPKGAGALIVDKATDMEPLLHGGGHEKGRRTGTENVAAIVGFGKAAELAKAEMDMRSQHVQPLREHLEQRLMAEMPEVKIFSQETERLPNTSFFAVPRVDGETLLMSLDQAGLAVSSGSACGTGEIDPSHVLMAMNVDAALARGAIRVSLGKDSQRIEIDRFVDCLKQQVQALQRFAAVAYA